MFIPKGRYTNILFIEQTHFHLYHLKSIMASKIASETFEHFNFTYT